MKNVLLANKCELRGCENNKRYAACCCFEHGKAIAENPSLNRNYIQRVNDKNEIIFTKHQYYDHNANYVEIFKKLIIRYKTEPFDNKGIFFKENIVPLMRHISDDINKLTTISRYMRNEYSGAGEYQFIFDEFKRNGIKI